jgi:4-amino-4-deoxy-L-arabinose transferase-like glycosyltransferase
VRNAAFLLAWLVATGCIFIRLGELPLIDPDEGRNTEIAREMKDSCSFVVPLYNGMPYLDKPAFYFAMVAASLSLFGENETAARLLSAIFGMLTLILVYLFCHHTYGQRAAILAVLVIGTIPLFIAFSRIVNFDMALTFFVCVALLAGYMALEKSDEPVAGKWYRLTALAAALATLVKGPVGFMLPLLGLLVYGRIERLKGGGRFFSPVNLLVFFAPVLAWFLAVTWQRPDFPYYGIVKESLERFTASAAFHRGAPVYYYIPVIAGVFFPWSLLLPEMIRRGWQQRNRATRADRILALFAIVVVSFFTISRSKLPGYILPGVVALGMLTARMFDLAMANSAGGAAQLIRNGTLLLVIVCGFAVGLLAANQLQALSLQAMFSIRQVEFERVQVMFQPLLIVLLVITVVALAARLSNSILAMLAVFALLPLLLLGIGARELHEYAERASSRKLAQSIQAHTPAGTEVACYRCFAPGLPYYLRQKVAVITAEGHETTSNYIPFTLQKSSQWPEQMVPLDEAEQWIAVRKQPVFLLSHGKDQQLKDLTALRGATLQELTQGWWGALIPAQGSH